MFVIDAFEQDQVAGEHVRAVAAHGPIIGHGVGEEWQRLVELAARDRCGGLRIDPGEAAEGTTHSTQHTAHTRTDTCTRASLISGETTPFARARGSARTLRSAPPTAAAAAPRSRPASRTPGAPRCGTVGPRPPPA